MNQIDRIENEVSNLNIETQSHSKRVGMYTEAFCLILGKSRKESRQIAVAAITHDLGKMYIDKEVLEKPDKLTDEEFELIKNHPKMGYDELIRKRTELGQSDEQFKITLDVALSHHEKYNGRGYPNQLKGDEIPIAAQIVGIVDVFDALSCERVYKKAWEQEKLINYMKEQSGIAFRSDLVNTFVENEDLFYKLKKYIGNENDISMENFENETILFLNNNKQLVNFAKSPENKEHKVLGGGYRR